MHLSLHALLPWLIALPALAVPAVLAFGPGLKRRTGYLAAAPVFISFLILCWVTASVGPQPHEVAEFSWIPSLDVNVSFLVDGLSIFYGLVICGVGTLVCWYAAEYLDNRYRDHSRFYACLLLFVSAMLGTVFSNNILLLFVFWELTSVTSFLLIGFKYGDPAAQLGARRALLVTGLTGLCLLVGIIMIGLAAGTYSLEALMRFDWTSSELDPAWKNTAFLLVALGIFGKSAQFPFYFWLPGAMVAPTPVSAYLHSATMVKLGVFLTARMFPIFGQQELWFPLLTTVCFSTMLLGAYLAFRSNDLKAILAYSTISQLGFLIGFYGLGGTAGVRLDFFHILSHVLYKGSLFMVAGIVDHATGVRDVRKLGGLARRLPLTALAALVGTAALAGVPFTTGFISKESVLTDLLHSFDLHPLAGPALLAMTVLSAILSVAVAARFFVKVFLGPETPGLKFHSPGWSIQIPPLLLAGGTICLGVYPGAIDGALNWSTVAGLHAPSMPPLKLWHGFNLELLMSLIVFIMAAVLYLHAERTEWSRARVPEWLRLDTAFDRGIDGLIVLSKRLTNALQADWPPAYLPIVIAFLLMVLGAFTFSSPWPAGMNFSTAPWVFDPLRTLVVVLVTAAMIGILFLRRWSAQLVTLSIAGFFITFYFVLYRAPDLAMTQILVESATLVMVLLLLTRFPSSSQVAIRAQFSWEWRHLVRLVLSVGMGCAMTFLVLFADLHRHPDLIGPRYLELSEPLAAGTNAVNTILVDFRGFDTLGEITVILTATLGGLGLMMRYKRSRKPSDPISLPGFFLGKEKRKP